MSLNITLSPPYLIYLGNTQDKAIAKTAYGLVEWAPEKCIGQFRTSGCTVDLGLPDLTFDQSIAMGAKSLVLGCAPAGGRLDPSWIAQLLQAIEAGLDIVSGLHTRLRDIPVLLSAAEQNNVRLIDIRIPPKDIPIAKGVKRSGKRLLTVGTDCAIGKKYAALAITKALQQRGVLCDFRATGQTGIMIAGEGMPIDAVISDFVAGAAELVSPASPDDHWDVIEGQGSLFHPAYAGVSLGLLNGSQPDALVLCHDPTRNHIISYKDFPAPDILDCMNRNLAAASLTNPSVRFVGVCVNTSAIEDEDQRRKYLDQLQDMSGLPCVDPLKDGVEAILDELENQ